MNASADIKACRSMLRSGSRTFFLASLLLPRRISEAAAALYAFCRLADDTVDEGSSPPGHISQLRERLHNAYEGRPLAVAVDRAFAQVVAQYAIPRALPEALLEGFEWDAAGRRYETLAELHAYAARVAGSVGAMMSVLMGVRDAQVVARASELGIAMQLSNIARDVGEDARAGRLYLPRQWLREAGIDPDVWLAKPQFSAALAGVIQRLLHSADILYRQAASGVTALPLACRPGIHVSRLLYAEIGNELQRRGLDSVSYRAIVPWSRKLTMLGFAMLATLRAETCSATPAIDAARFLVEAASALSPHAIAGASFTRRFDDRVAWLVDLFQRLERRDREERA